MFVSRFFFLAPPLARISFSPPLIPISRPQTAFAALSDMRRAFEDKVQLSQAHVYSTKWCHHLERRAPTFSYALDRNSSPLGKRPAKGSKTDFLETGVDARNTASVKGRLSTDGHHGLGRHFCSYNLMGLSKASARPLEIHFSDFEYLILPCWALIDLPAGPLLALWRGFDRRSFS